MTHEIGEKVYFWTIDPNGEYYLLGTVVSKFSDHYIIESNDFFFFVNDYAVIETVDIHKTGEPMEWINAFKFKGSCYETSMEAVFTNGLCYVFAEWLSKRLYQSEIVYLKNEHHYVVKYQNRLYDITGDVTEQFKNEEMDHHDFCGDWARHR